MSPKKIASLNPLRSDESLLLRRDFLKGLAAVGGASAIAASVPKIFAGTDAGAAAGTEPTTAVESVMKKAKIPPLAPGAEPREDYAPKLRINPKNNFGIKPREIPFAPVSYPDKYTGRRVTRLFPPGQLAEHPYFTSTTYDSESRLIVNVKIGDYYQVCRADMRRGTLHCLTDLSSRGTNDICICPARNLAIVNDGTKIFRMDLGTGACTTLISAPKGWGFGTPTIDDAGTRTAFSMCQEAPEFPLDDQIYSGMPLGFYSRPHSMIVAVDLDTNTPNVVWGEVAEISHVLVNPVDPDTIVFCHEGGGFADDRLWVVDARLTRKKHARCLYKEKFEEFLVHEYFCRDGTLGVQITEYDPSDGTLYDSVSLYSGMLFLNMDGTVVSKLKLPGFRSGHMQSNSNNSVILGDAYLPKPDSNWNEGMAFMSLNYPYGGDRLRTEKLCWHGSSWRNEDAHPHAVFAPNDHQLVFNSEVDGSNSVYTCDF